MNQKEKEVIKDIIENILKIRKNHLFSQELMKETDFEYRDEKVPEDIIKERRRRRKQRTIDIYDVQLVKLNNLLKDTEKFDEVNEIEQEIIKIQSKNNITTKEFAEIYNISISSQKDYRGRLNDPLPFHQKVARGTIVYVVEEVEKWFKNQYK